VRIFIKKGRALTPHTHKSGVEALTPMPQTPAKEPA